MSEVKSLAAQTAKATEDVSLQITQIQDATRNAVGFVPGIGGRNGELSAFATASRVSGAADSLSRQAEQFSSELGQLIAGVKAA